MSLPRLSIRRPVATTMFFLAVAVVGVVSFLRLPVNLKPDVAFPTLSVWTRYADAGPAEVERFVTGPVEEAVSRIPGVRSVSSRSREGQSLVRLRFGWGTDMEFAALHVRERLDNLRGQLPRSVERPAILRTDLSSDPILILAVTGRDLLELRNLSEAVFKRRLEQLDGVALAAVTGGPERQIQVVVDPDRLAAYEVRIQDVTDALDRANYSAPGGRIRRGRFYYSLRTRGEFTALDDIRQVAVRRKSGGEAGAAAAGGGGPAGTGRAVRLGELADVREGTADRETLSRYDGRPAIGLQLYKESGANTVRVAGKVRTVLGQLGAEFPDVQIRIASSQASFIRDAISNVVQALVVGGLLTFLVLFLFLRDPRYPVAIGLSIPLSVLAAFALCYFFDVSLNVMSLGGLALGVGMLVDNSIVVLENIFRHREGEGSGAREAAAVGAREVAAVVTASTLTTVAVFGPVLYVEGVAGALFRDLSLSVAFSLLASLLVALTLLPVLTARFVSRAGSRLFGPGLRAFERGFARFAARYERSLEWSLERRGLVLGLAGASLAVALLLALDLPLGLMPRVDERAFAVELELPVGTPLARTDEVAGRLERALLEEPGVSSVYARVGRARGSEAAAGELSGLGSAALEVRLAPDSPSAQEVAARLRSALPGLGVDPRFVAVRTGRASSLGRALAITDADLAVRIQGDGLDADLSLADSVRARLAGLPSLADVRADVQRTQPELEIDVDRSAVARHGLTVRQVADAVEDYLRGAPTGRPFTEFSRKVGIRVELPAADRRQVDRVMGLRVAGVPIGALVRAREGYGPVEIRHEGQSRTVRVLADVRGGGLGAATDAVRAALAGLAVPPLTSLRVGGANEEMRRSFRSLLFAFGLALVLVYLILAAQFESLVQPLVILAAVPLAAIGAVGALWIARDGLNVMSGIGLVVLIGIVVNDAIVKVDFINQRRAAGRSLRGAILEAGRLRLRPIVMTTVTTVFGLLPLALGWGAGADLRAPLAVTVIGGLVSSTLLTLIVVPVLYSLAVRPEAVGAAGGVT